MLVKHQEKYENIYELTKNEMLHCTIIKLTAHIQLQKKKIKAQWPVSDLVPVRGRMG